MTKTERPGEYRLTFTVDDDHGLPEESLAYNALDDAEALASGRQCVADHYRRERIINYAIWRRIEGYPSDDGITPPWQDQERLAVGDLAAILAEMDAVESVYPDVELDTLRRLVVRLATGVDD